MINCQSCKIGPYNKILNGKTITANIKPDETVGGENCEHLLGKAGNTNFEICSSKDNGFSLLTDKGYASIDSEGRVIWCKTIDKNGHGKAFHINA